MTQQQYCKNKEVRTGIKGTMLWASNNKHCVHIGLLLGFNFDMYITQLHLFEYDNYIINKTFCMFYCQSDDIHLMKSYFIFNDK